MGDIATAHCECGYSIDLVLGGGMANFQTVCQFPVYCRKCRSLQCFNLLDAPISCNKCGGLDVKAYDSPELIGEAGTGEVFSWHLAGLYRVLHLSDGRYLCPNCQQLRLRFEFTGCCD